MEDGNGPAVARHLMIRGFNNAWTKRVAVMYQRPVVVSLCHGFAGPPASKFGNVPGEEPNGRGRNPRALEFFLHARLHFLG